MAKPRVVVVRARGILESAGDIDASRLLRVYGRGLRSLTGAASLAEGLARLFKPSDRVGVKINTIGGRKLSTRPEVALGLAAAFKGCGVSDKSLLIWDRTNRELRDAGFAFVVWRPVAREGGPTLEQLEGMFGPGEADGEVRWWKVAE